jgi:hypothetical protein
VSFASSSSVTRRFPSCDTAAGGAAVALLAILLVFGIAVRHRIGPEQYRVSGLDDTALHLAIIGRISAGERVYSSIGAELRARGYPSASTANWRTPLHYWVVARVGTARTGLALVVLASLTVLAGAYALRHRFRGAGVVAGVLLMGTMVPIAAFRPAGIVMAEYWAGMLVALALALYHLRWWAAAACCGVAAIFVRELAVPFGGVCGLFALSERRHRESAVWVVGGLAYIGYYLLHAHAVSAAIIPTDWSWPDSWVRFLGWPFVLQTAWVAGWTLFLPYAVTPIMAVLALAGAFARSMPQQLRWPLVAYALLFCVVGQPFNFYWGFVTAPLWTYALLYSHEGARFLVSSESDYHRFHRFANDRSLRPLGVSTQPGGSVGEP